VLYAIDVETGEDDITFIRLPNDEYLPTTSPNGDRLLTMVEEDDTNVVQRTKTRDRMAHTIEEELVSDLRVQEQLLQEEDMESMRDTEEMNRRMSQGREMVDTERKEKKGMKQKNKKATLDRMTREEIEKARERLELIGADPAYEEGNYVVRKFHRYKEFSVGSDISRLPFLNVACLALCILGGFAGDEGSCHGYDGASWFCWLDCIAYAVFGTWFTLIMAFPAMTQYWHSSHIWLSSLWVFHWAVEVVWGGALLAGYAGSNHLIDPALREEGLFHSMPPQNSSPYPACTHSLQQAFIITVFGLALIKCALEDIHLRFDLSLTQYTRTFKWREVKAALPDGVDFTRGQRHIFAASVKHNDLKCIECVETREQFASMVDFKLFCQRRANEAMLGDTSKFRPALFHVTQPLFSRAWFGILLAVDTILVFTLNLGDVDSPNMTAPLAFGMITAIYYSMLFFYAVGAAWCGGKTEQQLEMEVFDTGVPAMMTILAALGIICWGIATLRIVLFESPYGYVMFTPHHASTRVATWFAILLSFLQLAFGRIEGRWRDACFGAEEVKGGYEKLNDQDDEFEDEPESRSVSEESRSMSPELSSGRKSKGKSSRGKVSKGRKSGTERESNIDTLSNTGADFHPLQDLEVYDEEGQLTYAAGEAPVLNTTAT